MDHSPPGLSAPRVSSQPRDQIHKSPVSPAMQVEVWDDEGQIQDHDSDES